MSTRSGKRIHSSFLGDTAPTEQDPAAKSERKTRSKRVKENLDELSVSLFKNKKRYNYVTYPTDDDELLGDTTTKTNDENKPSRVLRKNAFQEQNPVVNNENVEAQTECIYLIKKSRRGKRVNDANEIENLENLPAVEVNEKIPKSKKSKKKQKVNTVIDNPSAEKVHDMKPKRKKKKGKKTSSIIVEDVQDSENSKNGAWNKSSMSIDSFYSAAGSPSQKHDKIDNKDVRKLTSIVERNKDDEINKSSSKTNKKTIVDNTFDKNYLPLNVSMVIDNNKITDTFGKGSTTTKSANDPNCGNNCYVFLTRDNLQNDVESLICVSNLSNDTDSIFGKSNITTNVNLETDVENKVNIFNASYKQEGSTRSNVKDKINVKLSEDMSVDVDNAQYTFDKGLQKRNSFVKDVTFDKSRASDIVDKDKNIDFSHSISNKHLKARRSIAKDMSDRSYTSFNNSKTSDLNASILSNKQLRSRKSILQDTTFDKSNSFITSGNNLQRETEHNLNASNTSINRALRRRSYAIDSNSIKPDQVINITFEKDTDTVGIVKEIKKDSTFDKTNTQNLDVTHEKDTGSESTDSSTAKEQRKETNINSTYDKTDKTIETTFEKDSSTSFDAFKKGAIIRKSSIKDATFDKSNISLSSLTEGDFEKDNNIISSSTMRRKSARRQTFGNNDTHSENVNTTYENTSNSKNQHKRQSLIISQSSDIHNILNTTFEKDAIKDDKENLNSDSKSSLISSDNSSVTDKSDISRISITSDDTAENIVNTTLVLIESSMDESHISKQESPKPQTPLKREGTFTKDGPEVQPEPVTPTKSESSPVPSAGYTPYHINKSSQKKVMLNVTRSLEKAARTSVGPTPRLTRVMFCSPVDNSVTLAQEKRKVIKSNLKGSNKSFIFDDSASIPRPARKRSYTQNDADDARVKRTRLTEDLKQSVDRLSRPRTTSATAKPSVFTPLKKPPTPSKPKSDAKVSRTKLPNFAVLHQKQFEKMESLDECQERRAKRAKQLLTPTAPPGLLERISPNNNIESPKAKEQVKPKEKTDTPTKKLPTLESLRPGFTRFGFKLNLDVNPFSIPSKMEKPKEKPVVKPNAIPPRQPILPSLAGATSIRREAAKLTVMREKSFTDKRSVKRNENRTIIKGVRTNRRFELQMKMRNLE